MVIDNRPIMNYCSPDHFDGVYDYGYGLFFPVVNTKLVEVHSSNPELGRVETSGYYVDSTYCDIYARPEPAGRFFEWSDGSTDRGHRLFVTRDTLLTAYFEGRDTCYERAETSNGHMGMVNGGEIYFVIVVTRQGVATRKLAVE